jgi:hypothetical protein
MRFEIGAMSVGDILDRGLKLLFARLPTYYAINLLVLFPVLIAQLLQAALQTQEIDPSNQSQMGIFLGVMLLTLVLALFSLVFQPFGLAATLYIVWQEFLDRPAGLGAALRFAFSRFGQLFLSVLMRGLVVLLGFCFCIVPGIVLLVWFNFIPEIVVVEGIWGPDSFKRSMQLAEGFFWRILGLGILLIIAQLILQGGFFLGNEYVVQRIIPYYEKVPTQFGEQQVITNFPVYAVLIVAEFLLNILVQTFSAVCWTLFYFDLRIRKEGFDLEQAAQHPGVQLGDDLAPEAGL